MQTKLLIILCLIVLGSALHVNHLATLSAGKITLQSNSGKYLARCNGCGPSPYIDTAAVHETNPNNPWAIFTVVPKANGQVALKGDNGNYLARCRYCWQKSAYIDPVFIHVNETNQGPYSLWTPEQLSNGYWVFKSDNGNYLARCNGCVTGGTTPDYAFVHEKDKNQGYAQWTVNYLFPTGRVNLQSDSGKYLARCNGCAREGYYDDTASVRETNPKNPWAIFTVVAVGNKIALRGDNGKYLSRCRNCWGGAAAPNSDPVFVHVSDINHGPYVHWTPEYLPDGTWALKGDLGTYLARCSNCVRNGKFDFAFTLSNNRNDPKSHWKVTNA